MKKIFLMGVGFGLLLSAGAFAAQEPKQEAPRMVAVESAVRVYGSKFNLDLHRRKILESKLNEVATQEHTVEMGAAREIALSVRDMSMSEKIKRPEEDIVAQFLTVPGIAAQVGQNLPLRWNVQFEPGQEARTFNSAGHSYRWPKVSGDGHYLAFSAVLRMGKISILVWDMLKMEEDKTLAYKINCKEIFPSWDISPQGDALVYQEDDKIIHVKLRTPKDKKELDAQVTDGYRSISFSSDGKEVFGYEIDKQDFGGSINS